MKKALKYLLSAGLAALLLYFCFRNIRWGDFRTALRECNWLLMGLSMFCGFLALYLRGIRWRMMLRQLDGSISTLTSVNAVNICYAVNLVLPRVGELVRCAYVSRHSEADASGRKKASFDAALGTLITDRLWDTLSMAVIALAVSMAMGPKVRDILAGSLGGGISAGFGMRLRIILLAAAVLAIILSIVVYRTRNTNAASRRIASFAGGIWQGMSSIVRMKGLWKFILLTVLIWGMYVLTTAFAVWALKDATLGQPSAVFAGFGMSDSLLVMVAGMLSTLVPVPGGFGAYHTLVAVTLQSVYGIPQAAGVLFAILSHESQAIVQASCGLVSYLVETVRK